MDWKRRTALRRSKEINTVMEDLLTFLVKEITGNSPVTIEQEMNDNVTTYTIVVHKEYMGMLIGKNGRVIMAMRTLARVQAAKQNSKVNVELKEKETP